jgi:hypothetical protein
MKKIMLALLVLLVSVSVVNADQVWKKVPLTADASGDATAVLNFTGTITKVVFQPGSTAPSSGYDVELNDQAGDNLFDNIGVNLTNTTSSIRRVPLTPDADGTKYMPIQTAGNHTVVLDEAGNGGQVTVWIYYKK